MFMTHCNLQREGNRNSPAPNIALHSYNNNQFSSRLKSRLKPFVYVACAQKKGEKKEMTLLFRCWIQTSLKKVQNEKMASGKCKENDFSGLQECSS